MHLTANEFLLRSIVRRATTIDGVEVVEPDVVGMQVFQGVRIFFAAIGDNSGCILISGSHLAVYLKGKRADFQSGGWNTTKDRNHEWCEAIAHLYSEGATT